MLNFLCAVRYKIILSFIYFCYFVLYSKGNGIIRSKKGRSPTCCGSNSYDSAFGLKCCPNNLIKWKC